MSDEQEDYTRSFVTRSDIDKEAAWEANKKKIEKPGYAYIRHTSDEYVSGIRNASDGIAWGASQLNLRDLKKAVGGGADYDDTDIQRELAAQSQKIAKNASDIANLDANKADEGHTHDDAVSGDHTHDDYQPKGDYATKAELSTGLSGKADDPHTHDYATDDHDHDTVYQPKGDYATGDHGHDEYETKVDANLVHEALTESLAGKADDDHDHAGVYAPFDHDHDGLSTDDHTHDEYQPKGNYADATHLHTEYAETGDIAELTAAIEEEAKDRANADSILQGQVTANRESIEALGEKGYDDTWIQPALDKKADEPHTHDDLAAGDHDHSGVYSEEGHTHDEYLTDLPDHNHPHTHDEYLTELPDHDHPHGHDEYQAKGDYATKTELSDGLAGKEDAGHTHDTTHDHDEYARVEELETIKNEIIDIEAELEAIAPNREKGDWEATDGGAPRPGQANLLDPSFTTPSNVLVINQVDANQETHTFNEVEEGDNIEIAVDENNLGLYEVGPSTRSDVVSLNLILIKGQGSIKAGDQIKINIFGLADQNLDLEELDGRYFKLTGGDLASGGAYIGVNRITPISGNVNTLYEGQSYAHPQALINSAMMKDYAAEKEHEHDSSSVHVGKEAPEEPSEGDLWFLTTEDEDKPDKLFIWANDAWEPTTSLQHERQMRIAEDLLITQSLHRADSHYMYRLDKIVLPEPLFADKGVVVHDGELPDQITDDKIHFKRDYSRGDYLGNGQEFAFRGDDPGDGIRYAIMHHADPPITYREEWYVKSVTYANGTVTVRAQFAFGDHWGSYDGWPCSLWLLTEDDISDVPYLPTTGGTLNGNLNFSGEENYITENGNNRLRFNGKVIVNRGDSTNADGFEIKGKTSNGNNDRLLSVYHNASGNDAINYYGKQEGNENLATVKYVKDKVNNHNHDEYLLAGEWPEEDWPTGPMTGYEFWDFIDKMFKLNDFDQKLQDAAIDKKGDLDAENEWSKLQTMKVTEGNAFWTMKLNGGTVCTIWTDGQYTGKYVADPKQTAMITRKWYEEQEAILLQKINALEKRVASLEQITKLPFDSIELKLEMGKGTNGRPTGTTCPSGVAETWYLEPEGPPSPKNEMKLNIVKAIDEEEWKAKLREVHLIQGSKRQIWNVEGCWVTANASNVLHFSSNDVTGDTLEVDTQTEILFFEGPDE